MFCNDDFRQEDIDININNQNFNTNENMNANMNTNMNTNMMGGFGMGPVNTVSPPIIEQGTERVVNRTFVHEVPHICPVNTRIINNHVYKHTYQPRYTCCEENRVCNVQCGSCCCFR